MAKLITCESNQQSKLNHFRFEPKAYKPSKDIEYTRQILNPNFVEEINHLSISGLEDDAVSTLPENLLLEIPISYFLWLLHLSYSGYCKHTTHYNR